MHNEIMKILLSILLISLLPEIGISQKLPKNYGKLETKLFSPEDGGKSLLVAFGGSEGGNTFASEQTKDIRNEFLNRGFHFLSINYFGTKGLPKYIDRISLDAVYDIIQQTGKNLNISNDNIVLLGASRGGELILNLASNFKFRGVIALVPSSVTIPNLQNKNPTSSWILNQKQIEFIDIEETVLKKEGWSKAVEKSVKNQKASNPGFIKAENIKGFVILTSGKSDDLWPSYYMCNKMIERMEKNNFNFPYSHISFEGGHNPSTHWPEVFAFLDEVIQISMHNKR
jgi:esterase/lipase